MENHHLEQRVADLESRVAYLEGVKPFATHHTATAAAHASAPTQGKAGEDPYKLDFEGIGFENFIGGRVLLRAGVIAILLAVGFFLKYAFEQQLISDIVKVLVIAVFGAIMVVIGEFFARKHPIFGHVIAGGGVAVWFFDVVAARVLYNLMSPVAALITTLLLTALMLAYSVKRDSQPLLIAALSGAYLAPLFFGFMEGGAEHAVYTGLITLGALWFLQRKTEWHMYMLFPIVGFSIQMLVWNSRNLSPSLAALIVGIEFAIAIFFISRIWYKNSQSQGGLVAVYGVQALSALMLALAINFAKTGANGVSLNSSLPWIAPLLLAVCAVVVCVSGWALFTKKVSALVIDLMGVAAIIYLAVGSSMYFHDRYIIYAWLLITILAASVGALISRATIALGALTLSFFALIRFLSDNEVMNWNLVPPSLWLHDIVLLFVFMIAVMWFQAWLAQFHKGGAVHTLRTGAFILAEVTGIVFVLRQISVSLEEGQKKDIIFSIGLILYGVANVMIGFFRSSRAFRIAGLVVLGIAILKVSFADLWGLGTIYRIAVSLVLGILLVVSSLLYHKYADKT